MLNKTPISRLYAYARECVGRAIYREKWISSLTDDERDLIAELRPVNASSKRQDVDVSSDMAPRKSAARNLGKACGGRLASSGFRRPNLAARP